MYKDYLYLKNKFPDDKTIDEKLERAKKVKEKISLKYFHKKEEEILLLL